MGNVLTSKMQFLIMGWYQDFVCPGGDCGLTCCSQEWNIKLTDEEIEHYKKLDNLYRDTILASIDYDKKTIRCDNGKCNMLDKNGYCNVVIKCGEEHLSKTCATFPRMFKKYGDITEAWVELVCPLVAEFLLDNKPIDFTIGESDEEVSYTIEEIQKYDMLCIARAKLVEIMQILPGQYISGKLYVAISTCNKIREMFKNENVSSEAIKQIIEKYNDLDYLSKIFEQCEGINENIVAASTVIFNVLRDLVTYDDVLSKIVSQISKNYPDVSGEINEWINDRQMLEADLKNYLEFIRTNYSSLIENYMVYSLFTSWCEIDGDELFGTAFYARILEFMLIHIYGMEHYKKNGGIKKKDFSIIIALVDRVLIHSNTVHAIVKKYLGEKPDEVLNMMLMLLY